LVALAKTGVLPHNEYLRLLFEQGILGFVLFVFAWWRIIVTAPAGVRYIGLIVAIYSLVKTISITSHSWHC
jgi:O-antigen ligase